MRLLQILFITALIFPCLAVRCFAAGSGGFRNETPEAGAFGNGSAFVGEANTPAAVYYNPAGLNQINSASVTDGFAIVAPAIDYQDLSGETTQARRTNYLVPHFYGAFPVVKHKFTVGVGAGSYWGLGTEWAADSFAKYLGTKNELLNLDTMLTAAYQMTDQWSLAVGLDNDFAKADENKLLPQDGVHDAGVSLKAKDDAWGWRLATIFKINEQNQVGLMYRSSIHHRFDGKIYFDGLNDLGTTPFQTIFGGTSYETRAREKIVLPQSVILGYSFKPAQRWTFNADLEWMDWSSFKQETLEFPDETDPTRLAVLNSGNPVSHDWTAAWSEALGVEYRTTDRMRLRTGYYHHQKVEPQDNATPIIPDSGSHGLTAGIGYDLTDHWTGDIAYSFIFYDARKIDSSAGNLTASNISGTYSETLNVGLVSLTYKF